MMRLTRCTVLSAVVFFCTVVAQSPAADNPLLVAPTEPLTADEQLVKFHLPPGFEIELVASEPEVPKPINLNFDHRGRLFATCSLEYPFPAGDDAPARDFIRILSDTDRDGRYETVKTFAEGLNIPIGVLPLPGGVMAFSIPRIWFFADQDGDDRADSRRPYYETFETRDTHGMSNSYTRWIDGWIYGTHGFSNTSRVAGSDGQAIEMNSGNTYRLRADGSHIEYFTHGQVNPFGLAIDPLGNVYSSDCHTLPAYQLLRGAWYPSFGKPHDGMGFGPVMMNHLHGSTGIAGIVYYQAEHFPADFRDNLLIGNPVTGRINRDTLEVHGSTYRAIEQPDFVTCDDPWFRPVDLQIGPDGALYIADFYNRIIGHYEVPLTHPGRDRERGRIWRVTYRGDDPSAKPPAASVDLTAAPLADLLGYLDDTNLVVRAQATNELVDRFGAGAAESVAALVGSPDASPAERAHGAWVLERTASLEPALHGRLLEDDDRLVRVHSVKILAERATLTEHEAAALVALLDDDDAFVRRAAADALGRHPQPAFVRPLLELWRATDAEDTHLIHVVRMALRDHFRVEGMYSIATESFELSAEDLARIADVSLGVRDPRSARFVLGWLTASRPLGSDLYRFLHYAARYAADEDLPRAFAAALAYNTADVAQQHEALKAVHHAARERGAELPGDVTAWTDQFANQALGGADIGRGLDAAADLKIASAAPLVEAIAVGDEGAGLRRLALKALVAIDAQRAIAVAGAALGKAEAPIDLRQSSAAVLGEINSPPAREALAGRFATVPEQVGRAIAAALAASPEGAQVLLDATRQGRASPRLLLERNVRDRVARHGNGSLTGALEELTADLPPVDERIAALIDERRQAFAAAETDHQRGAAAYKKLCAACHRLRGEGTKIGPELDGIGQRGIDRLLEDMLDPSRNVDEAFRSTTIATVDGRVLVGLVLREEGQVLVLADAEGRETTVPLDEIESRQVGALSPMPANVPERLTEQEFYDLVAYLLAQRTAASSPQ